MALLCLMHHVALRLSKQTTSLLCVWCSSFFSSRRRHTRCSRDWSSDVCSSDLWKDTDHCQHGRWCPLSSRPFHRRSEERRVGKECRSRWSPHQYKKKQQTDS